MNYYFKIQLRRIIRQLKEFGVNPSIAIFLIAVFFFGLSFLLFNRLPEYAPYLYVFVAVNYLLKIPINSGREFLKLSFTTKRYRRLRVIENLLLASPFIILMGIQLEWRGILCLILLSILLSLFEFQKKISFSFPTPFSKQPFEYSCGFRKTYWLYLLAYILTVISVAVDNMNLGVFALLLVGLACIHFYSNSEPDLFVWVCNQGAKRMLIRKVKIALLYLLLSLSPILIALFIQFPEGILIQVIAVLVLSLLVLTNLLLKYAHFPRNIELIQMVMFPIVILFPPFLLVVIPYYYTKAVAQLNYLTK